MKRNLSSQAIRAMAIGMAVTLGSATAVSGVVTGTVVNVYAAAFPAFTNVKAEKTGQNDLKITIPRESTNVFKVEGTKKLTDLVITTSTGTIVFSTDDAGTIGNVTVEASSNNEELYITIPSADIKSESLDGSETALKITKLKGNNIKYGASGGETAINFDTNTVDIDAKNGNIGVDKKSPVLKGATTTYKDSDKTVTIELGESLATLNEKQSNGNFTITKKDSAGTDSVTVSKYKVDQGKLVLILDKNLKNDTYTITYVKEDAELKDAAGNKLTQASNNTVEVKVTAAPPVANAPVIGSNAQYAEDKKTITLTSDKDLNDKTEANKDTHGFVVKNSKKQEQEIKQVTVKGKEITIELNVKDALVDDTYTVGYTKGSPEFITTKDGAGKLDTNEKLATFKVSATVKPPVSGNLTATTADGNYTFKKIGSNDNEVALIGFTAVQSRAAQTVTFENGVLTAEGKTYTLTQIGDDSKTAITELTDKALDGHTSNVTTIKEEAFKGNTKITNVSFPKVTNVEANAFNGATALATIDLGSQANKTTVADNAFTDAKAITTVTTNAASKADVTTVAKKGNPSVKVEVSISEDKYNAKDAKIEKGKFYQTKDGLLFKGLETKNSLTFMGKKEFTSPTTEYGLDGSTEAKAYFVTYKDGKIKLQSEKTSEQPVEDLFNAEVAGNTLTFKKLTDNNSSNGTVALTNVAKTTSRAVSTGTLDKGVLTVGSKKYDLTQLGDGTNSLGDFADNVLTGNLGNVTTVKAKAFDGNKTITTITLPAVIKIEANAFIGTTALTKIDLGNNTVEIVKDAFKDAGNGGKITISSNDKTTQDSITANGGNSGITVENPAPEVVSGEVNKEEQNYVLTLTLSEKVFATQKPDFTDFVVKSGINSRALQDNGVKDISIENNSGNATNTVKLTLTKAVNKGDTVTVAYTKNANSNKQIKDTSTSDVKALENFDVNKITVVNSIQEDAVQTAPITINTQSSKVNGTIVTLTTNETTLETSNSPLNSKDGFVIKKGGSPATISKVEVTANNTIKLTLQDSVNQGEEVKFSYTGGNSEFKAGNKPVSNINEVIINNETNDAPKILTGSVDKSKKLITLTASEDLTVMSNNASEFGFAVTHGDGNTPCTVTKVEVKDGTKNKVEITVNDDISNSNILKVTYTKPGDDAKQIKDASKEKKALENITEAIEITPNRAIAQRDSDFAVIALAADKVEVVNGDVTGITSVKGATVTEINSILTDKLTKINSGAFKDVAQGLELDFSKVNVSNLNIESGAFSGAKGLNITGVNSSDTEKLAKMIGSSSDIKIDGKTTQDIIKDNSNSGNGGSGSGGGSSSGGSGGGSGANIGTITNKKPNTEETTSQGNKNETVVENKQLSFDVIKLPSVEGEAKVFGDVSANHWAKSYIDKLSTARIINGSNGMFNPNGQTKRADVTVMLVNLLGLTPEANNKFADVNASAYYAPYVGTASTYGIVNGSNGMFNPQGVISRQDTMVMIAQILKGLNLNVNADTTALSQFGDASKVSAYANESVAILVNSGIISGNNGKLNPTAPVTRAEMATIMSKLYDVLASANK